MTQSEPAALILVAGCYAIGYAVALSPGTLKRIEITNFITAYISWRSRSRSFRRSPIRHR